MALLSVLLFAVFFFYLYPTFKGAPDGELNNYIPSNEDAGLIEKATRHFNEGDYPKALDFFKQVKDKNGKVLAGIGISYFKLGDYDNAINYLEQAKSLFNSLRTNDNFLASKFLAFAYYLRDDFDRGISNAEAGLAIKNDPELEDLSAKIISDKRSRGNFIKTSSLNFKVIFDGATNVELGHKVMRILEEAQWEIGNKLGYSPVNTITVILYTEKDFHDVTDLPLWAGGVYDYDGKIRVPVKGIDTENTETLRKIIFHEYTHALIHSITANCPLWFNEGLAEFFSNGPSSEIKSHLSLNSLEKNFPSEKSAAVSAYNLSRFAVSRIIERSGFFAVKGFLFELSKGVPLENAFKTAFFVEYREFYSRIEGTP